MQKGCLDRRARLRARNEQRAWPRVKRQVFGYGILIREGFRPFLPRESLFGISLLSFRNLDHMGGYYLDGFPRNYARTINPSVRPSICLFSRRRGKREKEGNSRIIRDVKGACKSSNLFRSVLRRVNNKCRKWALRPREWSQMCQAYDALYCTAVPSLCASRLGFSSPCPVSFLPTTSKYTRSVRNTYRCVHIYARVARYIDHPCYVRYVSMQVFQQHGTTHLECTYRGGVLTFRCERVHSRLAGRVNPLDLSPRRVDPTLRRSSDVTYLFVVLLYIFVRNSG